MKFFFTILFFCIVFTGTAQNLVPNPSFEDTVACPDWISQVERAAGWSQFRPTADYFNSCSNSVYTVPYSLGYQCASTGNAYCGIWCYNSTLSNLREYIGRQLSTPLIIGQKYYITIRFNLSNGANCAVNKQGVLFSTVEYNNSNWAPITNFAHIYSTTIISDTLNWTNISGSFIADSAYQYIIIGSFFDDNNVDTFKINSSNNCISYYYIDDVCISADSLTCTDIKKEIIDFSSDSIDINEGSCISFFVNTNVAYSLLQWTFIGGNPASSVIQNPVICYDSAGVYSVTLIASAGNSCGDSIIKTHYIKVKDPISVRQEFLNEDFEVYPNPAYDKLFIKMNFNNNKLLPKHIIIYNMLGSIVYEDKDIRENHINLKNLSNGTFLLKIFTENKTYWKRINILKL